jgi:hypothetical protein
MIRRIIIYLLLVSFNTQGTNLERGSDIARSLAHEQARHKIHTGDYKISEPNQTKFSTLVGKMAESTWQNVHGDNHRPMVSVDDWNVVNRDSLSANSKRLASVDDGVVREREYRVNTAVRWNAKIERFESKNGPTFSKLSDKGGEKIDYWTTGTYNELGEFIRDSRLEIVTKRNDGSINSFRIMKDDMDINTDPMQVTDKSIASIYLGLDKEGNAIEGWSIEKDKEGNLKEGGYKTILSKDRVNEEVAKKLSHPNNFVLENKNLKINADRGFTLHSGNFFLQTDGCPMLGKELGFSHKGEYKVTLPLLNSIRTYNSIIQTNEITDFIHRIHNGKKGFSVEDVYYIHNTLNIDNAESISNARKHYAKKD